MTFAKRKPILFFSFFLLFADSEGSYPLDRSPFIALRGNRIDGEDYGRGYVEEYLGDLKSLEGLSRAIVEGSAAAAKVLFLINPNGTTRAKTLAESPNGAIREGNEPSLVKGVASGEAVSTFRSTAELVAAMKDPKYKNDPAYRQDVIEKLGRSSIF